MADTSFTKFVPGFEFLQGLVKNAGSALPAIGQWVAPTLNPEELEKRIEELRTVQFWLEQNARMLSATIQALEVQRMTLSTLKSMNVPLSELQQTLRAPMAAAAAAAKPPAAAAEAESPAAKPRARKAADDASAAPVVDPMQWWGALSQQFTQLAANAMKDSATDAAKNLAGAIVKQSFDAAGETLRKAAAVPGAVAGSMASTVGKSLKPAARTAHGAGVKKVTKVATRRR